MWGRSTFYVPFPARVQCPDSSQGAAGQTSGRWIVIARAKIAQVCPAIHTTSQEGNGQRAESAAQLRRHGTKEGFQPGVLVHKHKREGLDNPDGELVLNSQFVELVPLELGQHGGLEKTCNVRMVGKEKESIKSKGKQRRVGEMAIRWIAIVQKFRCPVRVVPTAHTPLARSSNK